MKKLAIGMGCLLAVVFGYVLIHLAMIEIGQEIAVLHKETEGGAPEMTRLWIVDEGGETWLHHGDSNSFWIQRLETEPELVVERDGEARRYRASADTEVHAKVHRLLREKYGTADRLVRFWAGTDAEPGVATGEICPAPPVRLEAL